MRAISERNSVILPEYVLTIKVTDDRCVTLFEKHVLKVFGTWFILSNTF